MIIQLKAKEQTWNGRTVCRSYYLDGRTWRRFGNYEAASEEVLRRIIDNMEHSAEFVWR
jgi:hypothetical protein